MLMNAMLVTYCNVHVSFLCGTECVLFSASIDYKKTVLCEASRGKNMRKKA